MRSVAFGYAERSSPLLSQFGSEGRRGSVTERRVRPPGIVIIDPDGDLFTGMSHTGEQRLIQQFVAHPAVEALDEGVLGWLARRRVMPLDPGLAAPFSTAFEVSSVPLSLTIMPGLPRTAISLVNSRTTRLPEIKVSGTAARHSRVTSSTTLSTRNGDPSPSGRAQNRGSSVGWEALEPAPARGIQPPASAPCDAAGQTFLAIAQATRHAGHAAKAKPLRLLAVDRDAFPPQQDVQAAITEPATLMRQIAQLLAQAFVARPLGLLKNARSPRRNDPARPPLADIRQGLKMRDRFPLGSSRYHFLAAGPSDDGAQVSIVRSNSSS